MGMATFSQRYGYTPLEKAIRKECMPDEIKNSLCSAFDLLSAGFKSMSRFGEGNKYKDLELHIWLKFLNYRFGEFEKGGWYHPTIVPTLGDQDMPWYRKLDMVEMAISYLLRIYPPENRYNELVVNVIDYINSEFERHGYAYRIVGDSILEITSEQEIKAIEDAIAESKDNVKAHLSNAIANYAIRPEGDYANSIKESISAVEAVCRDITGKTTLGDALNDMQSKGVRLPKVLKAAFDKLYAYTNQPSTGIRHALMETEDAYIPGNAEARYMLIVCSAFINYLRANLSS